MARLNAYARGNETIALRFRDCIHVVNLDLTDISVRFVNTYSVGVFAPELNVYARMFS